MHPGGSISPPPGDLERLTLVAHTLRRAGAERVTALLPYLAYARQDRAACGESLGLAWVGELLRAGGVDTGATLVSCCRALRDGGVEQIGVIATQGLFTGDRWRATRTSRPPVAGSSPDMTIQRIRSRQTGGRDEPILLDHAESVSAVWAWRLGLPPAGLAVVP